MAKKEKDIDSGIVSVAKKNDIDDMTNSLIRDINKEFGTRVAYNLSEMDAPTIVKRWIDTGSVQLNYAISLS